MDKANTFQLILPVRNILTSIARNWRAPIPKQFLQQLKIEEVSPVDEHAFILSRTKQQSEGQGYWLRLNEITGWRKRLIHVLKWLFPPPASLRSRYRFAQPLLLPLVYL